MSATGPASPALTSCRSCPFLMVSTVSERALYPSAEDIQMSGEGRSCFVYYSHRCSIIRNDGHEGLIATYNMRRCLL
jgi:hypothetical protein